VRTESSYSRSIGELTDIRDEKGDVLLRGPHRGDVRRASTLRPEATRGVVRAGLSHESPPHSAAEALVLRPELFRAEKPQIVTDQRRAASGSFISSASKDPLGYRPSPEIDAELIALSARLLEAPSENHERPRSELKLLSAPWRSAGRATSRRPWSNFLRVPPPGSMKTALRRLGPKSVCVSWDSKNPDLPRA
jgi:hypothetical protein